MPATEHFRNVKRHDVIQNGRVLAVRIDESLTFVNAPYLESYFLERISERPDVKYVLLIAAGINDIDATGLEVLETIREELKSAGVELFLSDVKGPVMDRIQASGFDPDFLHRNVFLSAHLAMQHIEPIENDEGRDKTISVCKKRTSVTAKQIVEQCR